MAKKPTVDIGTAFVNLYGRDDYGDEYSVNLTPEDAEKLAEELTFWVGELKAGQS